MSKSEKTAWGLCILSWAVLASYYYVARADYKESEAERIELRKALDSLETEASELRQRADRFREENHNLNEIVNEQVTVIAELRARPEPRSTVKWKYLPPDCAKCMEENSLPITVNDDRKWGSTHVRDAFHPEDGATIEFLPAFHEEFLGPRQRALDDCNKSLGECTETLDRATTRRPGTPEKPLSFDSEHAVTFGAGYVPSGEIGGVGYYSGRFVRFGAGKGLNVRAGIDAGAYSKLDGTDVEPYITGGIEIRW